eukprot:05650.XXX_59783_59908_1 [CDS] Oithona nana genome sequencing.
MHFLLSFSAAVFNTINSAVQIFTVVDYKRQQRFTRWRIFRL